MNELWIDFETASTVDVTTAGAYRLMDDPTMRVTLVQFAIDDGPVQVIEAPLFGAIPPQEHISDLILETRELRAALRSFDVPIYAHNAGFERLVLHALGWNNLPPSRFRDTATIARWYNLPASLKGFASAAGDVDKLDATSFKKLWSHRLDPETGLPMPWPDDWQGMYEDMIEYGVRDVEAMRAAVRELPALPEEVWQQYADSERINDRGVCFDLPLARAAVKLRTAVEAEAKIELAAMTQGAVESPRGPAARLYVVERLKELEAQGLLPVPILKDGDLKRGFKKRREHSVGFYTDVRPTFDRAMRATVRKAIEEVGAEADLLRDVLDAVDEGNVAALTKFAALEARGRGYDGLPSVGVMQGMYIFAGATQTHRYSSTGVQTHNLLRDTHGLVNDWHLRRAILQADGNPAPVREVLTKLYPDPKTRPGLPKALGMLLRPSLTAAPGGVLVWRDWSAVEARGLPWLADDPDAEDTLDVFRRGEDIYVREALGIFGSYDPETHPDAKYRRQIGKVSVLSLGFGGSVGAFAAMGRNYGISLPTAQVQSIVKMWRANNPWAQRFWDTLIRAAFNAMKRSNWCEWIPAGRVQFIFAPNVLGGSLMMGLPDGSILTYPRARIEQVERFEGQPKEPTICFDHPTYGRSAIWYGLLAENATQAICASLLRHALRLAEADDLCVAMHTHDEIVAECDDDDDEIELVDAALKKAMETPPDWAEGFPIDSEAGVGFRYKLEDSVE